MRHRCIRNFTRDHIAREILCNSLRKKAQEGDPEARTKVFRVAPPMLQAKLLDRWNIPPEEVRLDCMGEIIFA